MNISPVLRAAASGILRRRVQTAVVFVVLLGASASATVGLTLYTSANEGFQDAFAQYHAAHLAVFIDAKRATPAELHKTAHLPEVIKTAGPYPATTVTLTANASRKRPLSSSSPASVGPPTSSLATIVGRASRGGVLDDLTLNGGRPPTAAGEIALGIYDADLGGSSIGSSLTAPQLSGRPQLRVVAKGGSVVRDEDAWTTPSEIATLIAAGAPDQEQMLYTFHSAATAVEINADLKTIEAALPNGAVVSSVSWLLSSNQIGDVQNINTPFVLAFALLAIALAALITAAVVSGVVLASSRRIGVLKSIGFTPAQITSVYVLQVIAPAVLGAAAGVILGHKWVIPLIDVGGGLFGLKTITVPLWVTVAAPAAMVAIVVLAALVPAVRSGRLSTIAAIAAGQAPTEGAGHRARRAFARLPAPRPVTLGLAAPFSRPARSTLTAAVICFGVAAVGLAIGLHTSVDIFTTLPRAGTGQAQITLAATGTSAPSFNVRQSAAVTAALAEQPGTEHSVAALTVMSGQPGSRGPLTVPDLQFPLRATIYKGDPPWLHGTLTAGSWYGKTGQIDVNHEFLTQTGLHVGNTLTLNADSHLIKTTIVGEVFDPGPAELFAGSQTFAGTSLAHTTTQYDIALAPHAHAATYMKALTKRLGSPVYAVTGPLTLRTAGLRDIDTSLINLLTALVALLAALGVLNAIIVTVRERVRQLGVVKAIGMTPRQTVSMVLLWAVAPSVGAAVIGIPTAIALHDLAIHAIGSDIDTGVPGALVNVYHVGELVLLPLTSLGLAALGSLGPAIWAALSRTAAVLRTE